MRWKSWSNVEGRNAALSVKWTEARSRQDKPRFIGESGEPNAVPCEARRTPQLWTPDDAAPVRGRSRCLERRPDAIRDVDKATTLLRHAQDQRREGRPGRHAADAQQQAGVPDRAARSGLVAGRAAHAAVRRGDEVRPRSAQEARLEHAPQAHQGRAGAATTTTATSSACSSGRTCPAAWRPGRRQFVPPNAKDDAEFTAEEKKQFRTELKAMIDHLRFFPCIVVWVPFNEGWGQHDTNDILKWVKEYDPSRLVNGPSGWTDRGYGDMKDMHNYPGPGMFPVMPDRVSVLGEFGGLGLPLKGHLWKDTDNWGYRTLQDDGGTARRLPHADAPAAPAHRQGTVGRGLHADDRRRGRSERPDDLRPRGHQARRRGDGEVAQGALRPAAGVPRARADVARRRRRSGGTRPRSPPTAGRSPTSTPRSGPRATAASARRARRARSSAPSGRRPTSGSAGRSS